METASRFGQFVQRMDALVEAEDDPLAIADETGALLGSLLPHPEFLRERFRQPGVDSYRQHVVHVHPEGRYSVVSLVWKPGQATPIHDHRCWCVVGVLMGRELETRFHLYRGPDCEVLVRDGERTYEPGQVCRLVPPNEDIHRVANAGDDRTSISIHVYGADIAKLRTSINHVFEQGVVDRPPVGSHRVSWRDVGPGDPWPSLAIRSPS
jgi:predicted metal-dependent enzyme (double-stranded beta helix superfamily)